MDMVSLGPKHGIMVMNGLVQINDTNGKLKYEILEENKNVRNGVEASRLKQLNKFNTMRKAISFINTCCCCCPCSETFSTIIKARPSQSKKP
jgi:hypothetical protein